MSRVPKKLLILRRLTRHLEAISIANGYDLDMMGRVFRGRARFGNEEDLPYLSILEAPRQVDPNASSAKVTATGPWQLLIQGFAEDDRQHPTDPAYVLAANTQQRMARLIETERGDGKYPDEYLLGGTEMGVTSVALQEPIVRPPDDDVSDTAFFYLPVTIGLVTDLTANFMEE